MAGSIFGTLFQVSTWGESHGEGIGVVVDGCPAGLDLSPADIQAYLNRRRPGQSRYATPRREADEAEILSGVFEGRTTGSPISMLVRNKTQQSKDYRDIAGYYRPGHADFTFDQKYGFRDYRGGGRSSGRETIARVAAGAIACKILGTLGITLTAYTKSIGPICISPERFCLEDIYQNPLYMPDAKAAEEAAAYLDGCMKSQDSSGGVIECVIHGMPTGIGQPVFDKLDAVLAHAILSIGAVKGFEVGDGFAASIARGSQNNDSFIAGAGGTAKKASNHAGGILGGMSDGSDIILRAAVKPTPSISRPQQTINQAGEEITVQIHGRHDPIIVPRAVVVVESMAALAVTDLLFVNMSSRLDRIQQFYR